MDARPALHPTDRTLHAYGLGQLDNDAGESVHAHLEGCPDCRRRVAEMSSDSFLGRLRDAGARPESFHPAVSSTDGLSMLGAAPGAAAPPPPGSLPPGLADHPDYEVLRELGQGGMGVVYLAQNTLMGRLEVLKVVSAHLVNRKGVLDRFLVEIRNAARLHHPNIVTAFTALRLSESLVLAMEYVEGLDLARLVKTRGPLPVANACNYTHQAAQGLQHAHEHGMVHRDIKPANLMLTRQGNRALIKVLDFGLAKVKSERGVDGGLTNEGQMLGTPHYIAPEQTIDARRADIRADIYSLGCTLYYLLTGEPPFDGTNLYDILQAHHSREALPLNLARPQVTVELAALVAKMMAKEPERRFQEPKEVAQALKPFFKSGNVPSAGSRPDVSRPGQSGVDPGLSRECAAQIGPATGVKPPSIPNPPSGSAQPEPIWNSLIDVHERQPLNDALQAAPGQVAAYSAEDQGPQAWKTAIANRARRVSGSWRSIIGVFLLCSVVALAASVLRGVTENGVTGPKIEPATRTSRQQIGSKDHDRQLPPGGGPDGRTTERGNGSKEGDDLAVRTAAISARLKEPIAMRFPDKTPLDNVLSYIKKVTKKGSEDMGIPIYVDPIGLQEAERSLNSTITIDLESTTLENALALILKQHGLSYFIKDSVLIITSREGIDQGAKDSSAVRAIKISARTNKILAKLDEPIAMNFANETPLDEVLKYIKQATTTASHLGLQIYVDPVGLQEAERSLNSTVQIELEGVPLKVTLRLILKQLGLAYCVRDDVLFISSPEDVQRELGESPKRGPMGEGPQELAGAAGKGGAFGDVGDGKPPVLESLFNSQDLTGWKDVLANGSEWKVIDGILEGRGGGERGTPALLLTDRRDFMNFELHVKARYPLKGAGRIEVRHVGADDNMSGYHIVHGLWSQPPAGSVGHARESRYGGAIDWDHTADPLAIEVDQWHTFDIIAVGNRIIVSINGNQVLDFTDATNSYATGGIAMICGYNSYVQIKEIQIKRLPDGSDPNVIRERGGRGMQ